MYKISYFFIFKVQEKNATISAQIDLPNLDEYSTSKHQSAIYDSTSCAPKMKAYQWLKEPQLYIVGCIYIVTRIFVNVSNSYLTFYLQYTVSLPTVYVAVAPLVMYVSGFLISIILKRFTEKYGYKNAFALSCLMGLGTKRILKLYI